MTDTNSLSNQGSLKLLLLYVLGCQPIMCTVNFLFWYSRQTEVVITKR